MRYLHAMVRVTDLDRSIAFFRLLGLREQWWFDDIEDRYTVVYMAAPGQEDSPIELKLNWDIKEYSVGTNFGHLAFRTADIYDTCRRLMDFGITINRPPRDGHLAFVRSPDGIAIELLQDGHLPAAEPWMSMPDTGTW